jgi:hypothetical protein
MNTYRYFTCMLLLLISSYVQGGRNPNDPDSTDLQEEAERQRIQEDKEIWEKIKKEEEKPENMEKETERRKLLAKEAFEKELEQKKNKRAQKKLTNEQKKEKNNRRKSAEKFFHVKTKKPEYNWAKILGIPSEDLKKSKNQKK